MLQKDGEKNCYKHRKVIFFFFYSSVIVNVEDNYQFSLEGWMPAICSDFALNLGNIREHVFSLFLIPSPILAVLWLRTVTT